MIGISNNKQRNLRFRPLDYSGHENSFWRLKIFEKFEEYFNIERFHFNLEKVNKLAKNNHQYVPFSKFYNRSWDTYEPFIKNFKNYFIDSATQLSETIPYVDNEDAVTSQDIYRHIQRKLKSSSQSWVIISDDHRISHVTIQELASQSRAKIAVIVIDNHADIYGNAPAKNTPLKFNPFRNLIELRSVEHVIFLCPQFAEIIKDQKGWTDISPNISLVPFRPGLTGEFVFDDELFESTFTDVLKRKQIQNIYYSIDIDALVDPDRKKLYTAFEYSVLNSVLYLSLLSEDQLELIDSLSNSTAKLEKIVGNGVGLSEVKLRNPYQPNLNTVNEVGVSPTTYIETIKKTTELARSANVSVGLGSCVGEVVELWGPDWKGMTTEAVLQFVETLNNL